MGLASRRRYRWTRGRITDYWDEVFTPEGLVGHAALDDQSAFIASLGGSRSGRMRDVLGTIQADQDAIIRAGSRGTLVVDGGPGTGKTVVALHRAAYLLYADPRLGEGRGRRALRRTAPALPGLRRRRTAQPRRGGRADLHPARPPPRGGHGAGRSRPGGGPAQVDRRHGDGDRAGGPALRGAADRGHGGRDPVGRRLARTARLDRGVRVARARNLAQRGRATRSGRSCSRSSWTSTGATPRTPTSRRTWSAVRSRRTTSWSTPSAGPGR